MNTHHITIGCDIIFKWIYWFHQLRFRYVLKQYRYIRNPFWESIKHTETAKFQVTSLCIGDDVLRPRRILPIYNSIHAIFLWRWHFLGLISVRECARIHVRCTNVSISILICACFLSYLYSHRHDRWSDHIITLYYMGTGSKNMRSTVRQYIYNETITGTLESDTNTITNASWTVIIGNDWPVISVISKRYQLVKIVSSYYPT